MPLLISDEALHNAGLTEQDARTELACRLFDIGKLALWPAAELAGLSRIQMEEALRARKIPIYRIDEDYWSQEKESLRALDNVERKARA